MIINFKYPLGPNTIFSEQSVEHLVDSPFSAKLENKEIGIGKVVAAKLIEEGRFLDLTLEWPDDPESQRLLFDPLTDISFG